MHMKYTRRFAIGALALLFAVPALADAPPTKRALVVGRISENPNKHFPGTKLMADYLAKQLKDLGIEGAHVQISSDAEQMIRFMKEGRVDVVNETVFTSMRLVDEANGELLLKGHRKRAGSYRAVFFARKDSAINSLADLRGHVLALEDDSSTTGFMIPAAIILSQKLPLMRLSSPRQPVPADSIGYIYSTQEINTALLVHKRIADAGVFSNVDLETEGSMPQEMRKDIKVFHQSPDFPRSLVVVRRSLTPAIKQRLKKILLAAPSDAEGAPLLKGYHAITKFEPLNDADKKSLDEGRRLGKIVRTKLK